MLLLAGLGGSAGAVLRYVVSGMAPRWNGFPGGTLLVNVLGSTLLSAATFSHPSVLFVHFFNIGVLGAFTTFSTFSYESLRMLEAGEWRLALVNVMSNLLLCSAGVFAGRWLIGWR